jgi:hypothetical protein
MRLLMALAAFAVMAAIAWFARSRLRSVPIYSLAVRDIPRVLAALPLNRADPVFAVFIFNEAGHTRDEDAINVQFSVEDGRRGFDWVLLGAANVRDGKRYVAFAQSLGYQPTLVESNGVGYWRVEQGDLSSLCEAVITGMYQHPTDEPIEMIVEGFDWTQ